MPNGIATEDSRFSVMAASHSSEQRADDVVTQFLDPVLKEIPRTWIIPLSGGLAGAASGIVSCPLDVIKTKLQAQGGFRVRDLGNGPLASNATSATYHGVKGTAQTIWREDGLRGLYRGLGPMLLGYIPTWAVYLTIYNVTQDKYSNATGNKFLGNICASLTAGACSTVITNPIWVIKTRLMSQSSANSNGSQRAPWHYNNTLDAAVKMYRNEGILSFYSGLTPAMLGLTHVAIQFPLYELFKAKFTGIESGQKESEEDRAKHFWALSAAVFLSKVCASTATYPHEVLRTRLQTQQREAQKPAKTNGQAKQDAAALKRRGTIETCKIIIREEGWRGFYAGLGTNLIRAVPSAMTTILTYEYLKKALMERKDMLEAHE